MWPRVNDGYWCIFEPYRGGTRQDRLVLVEDRSKNGGDRYTLKKFRSKKIQSEDGSWRHEEIELLPLNSGEHPPIRLFENCNYEIRGWFVGAVKELDRVDPFLFRNVSNDVGRASVDFEGYW